MENIDYYADFVDGRMFPDIFKQSLEPVISYLYSLLKESSDFIMYYNDVARTVRLLMGKFVVIEYEGAIL